MTPPLAPKAIEIVDHTRVLLAAGGYNSFSYADLAQRVGITKASIHHHFPAKSDLVKVVVTLHREHLLAAVTALAERLDDPAAELHAYAQRWSECIVKNDPPFCICAMLATEMPTLPPEVAEEVHQYFDSLGGWLESVIERGARRSVFVLNESAASCARKFMATVHGAMLVARALNDPRAFSSIVLPALEGLAAPARAT